MQNNFCKSQFNTKSVFILELSLWKAVVTDISTKLNHQSTLISWICESRPPMSAYVSWGAFSSFITVTMGSVSSPSTPTTACTWPDGQTTLATVQQQAILGLLKLFQTTLS